MPVGSHREHEVDVRIVASTHRDLASRVSEGLFREDLYHRLAVVPVELPPLRKRREDIGLLIDHLLARYTPHGRTTPYRASKALREALAQCDLPGNVRQLENLLRQAIVSSGDATELDLVHLPAPVLRSLCGDDEPFKTEVAPAAQSTGQLPSLDEIFSASNWRLSDCSLQFERTLLKVAYIRSHGNQAAMARLLGVTPRCIYTKLRRHLIA